MSSVNELDHLRIPLKEIESATNSFDDGSFIGEGGFGRVYKADFSHNNDRRIVAIKRLDRACDQGEKEFMTEITMLSSYKHKNLVSLLGFCDEGGEKILVYQYEVHGSLDKYLRNTNVGYNIAWIERLKICIGAAHGLDYLHNGVGQQLRIIHRDIKSSNILLDENWEAKIADFGLSKIGTRNQQITFLITNPAGTSGYCDPQYLKTGFLTKESDVYSFGVVLFEVLCGRLACVADYHDERRFLAPLARLSYEHKDLDEIIDHNIRDQIEADSLKIFSEIAYQCLQEHREKRPTMTRVVRALENALEIQLTDKRLQPSTSVHPDFLHSFVRGIGVCYGMMGNNLPSPSEVIRLCESHKIRQMRLYDPDQALLESLRGSNIQVMLGVPNSDIQDVASSLDNAQNWVEKNIINYWPDVRFHYLVVGNAVNPREGGTSLASKYVYRALINLHKVIELTLHGAIKVSTAIDIKFIIDTFPPSDGCFRPSLYTYMDPIISFLVDTNAPLLANIYPYFSYAENPRDISLSYALFTAPNAIVQDGANEYQNLFDAMLDAIYSSLEKVGGASLEVVISETGWPSSGGFAATEDNARIYYTNLVDHVIRGTPKRPGRTIETYMFALFDENQKNPELDKHFGLFYPNQEPKFQLDFGGERIS